MLTYSVSDTSSLELNETRNIFIKGIYKLTHGVFRIGFIII